MNGATRVMITAQHSDPPARCRTLGEYIAALLDRLGEGEPTLHARLRDTVGSRRARITLDAETVDVWFAGGSLTVAPLADRAVDGTGETDRFTTLSLLRAELEVTDAILEDRLRVIGELDSLVRIFQAIEILLDGSVRIPSLQRLALDYDADPCRPAPPPGYPRVARRRVVIDPDHLPAFERDMLHRLDLLP